MSRSHGHPPAVDLGGSARVGEPSLVRLLPGEIAAAGTNARTLYSVRIAPRLSARTGPRQPLGRRRELADDDPADPALVQSRALVRVPPDARGSRIGLRCAGAGARS